MIIPNNQLNNVQLRQLDALYKLCQNTDHGAPAIYRHLLTEKRTKGSTILYYQHEQLIGFLAVYFFYHDACEVSVLVHPHYRRQKIASLLLKQIFPLLTEKRIQSLIFSTSTSFSWLAQHGFSYLESEYHMERDRVTPEPLSAPVLTVNHATINDIPVLVEIDQTCFPENQANTPYHFASLLKNPLCTLLLARLQGRPIGKAHIRRQNETLTCLSDIAILPPFQRQGFGHELLAHTINEVFMSGKTKLALDVTTNPQSKAFNLYSRHGFKITLQYDYWVISFNQLRSQL